MFFQALGTALWGWTADTASLGYLGAAYIFRTLLFRLAFVLTSPLGPLWVIFSINLLPMVD